MLCIYDCCGKENYMNVYKTLCIYVAIWRRNGENLAKKKNEKCQNNNKEGTDWDFRFLLLCTFFADIKIQKTPSLIMVLLSEREGD